MPVAGLYVYVGGNGPVPVAGLEISAFTVMENVSTYATPFSVHDLFTTKLPPDCVPPFTDSTVKTSGPKPLNDGVNGPVLRSALEGGVAVGVGLGVGVAVGTGVAVGFGVGLGVGVDVGIGVGLGAAEALGTALGADDALGDALGDVEKTGT